MSLPVATTPDQSGPGSDGNEGVLCIPQSFEIGVSLSDCLVSYLGHSLGGVGGLTPLQRFSRCILQPKPTGSRDFEFHKLMISFSIPLFIAAILHRCITPNYHFERTYKLVNAIIYSLLVVIVHRHMETIFLLDIDFSISRKEKS